MAVKVVFELLNLIFRIEPPCRLSAETPEFLNGLLKLTIVGLLFELVRSLNALLQLGSLALSLLIDTAAEFAPAGAATETDGVVSVLSATTSGTSDRSTLATNSLSWLGDVGALGLSLGR